MSLALNSTDTPSQCTDLQGSTPPPPPLLHCCQGGQHEHNVSLFLCRPLSHAWSVTGRPRRLRWGPTGSSAGATRVCRDKPNGRGLEICWHVVAVFQFRWRTWKWVWKGSHKVSSNHLHPIGQQDDGEDWDGVCWQTAATPDFNIVNTRGTWSPLL